MVIKGMKTCWLSLLLCLCVLFSSAEAYASAAEDPAGNGLCEHHPAHTDQCGYAEENACTYAVNGCPVCTAAEPLPLVVPYSLSTASRAWDPISTSKTATALENNFSDITLTVGRQSTRYDLVFVMDNSSCESNVTDTMMTMLARLEASINAVNPDAEVRVGGVKFKGSAQTLDFPLTALASLADSQWTHYITEEKATGAGTNMHAGLVAAQNMLAADTDVPDPNKFVVLISDGITYLWNETVNGTAASHGINYYEGGKALTYATPSVWEEKYGKGYVPDDWSVHLGWVSEQLDSVMAYASVYDRSNYTSQPAVNYTAPEGAALPTSVDVSLYRCSQVWNQMGNAGYQAFAVTIPNSSYPFAAPFITDVLNGGQEEDIEAILSRVMNRIVYSVVAAGSVVTDYMGYSDAVDGTGYDFDFVNDKACLTVRVGTDTLNAEVIAQNQYGFGKQSDGTYRYTLTYTPDSPEGEHFAWTIHVPVESLRPVQLTYRVELTPPTAVGTHTLYPNSSAVLSAVDTEGQEEHRIFERPSLLYIVEKNTVCVSVRKVWLDGDNFAGIRPDAVTVELLADGRETGTALTLRAEQNWTDSFTDLDAKRNGEKIQYTVREVPVEGYNAAYSGTADTGFTVTNTIQYIPATGVILNNPPWMIAGIVALLGFGALLLERGIRRRGYGGRHGSESQKSA